MTIDAHQIAQTHPSTRRRRLLVSFTSDGIALRTAPLQQAAPPALGTEKMFISTTDFIGGDGRVLASSGGLVEGTRMQVEAVG